MDYADKVAFITAILVAARIQRGTQPDSNGIREAVKTAKAICEAVGD